ncbi:autotransporter outer membrane beta-barrel domain-containing protein [Chromobacterium violaceum]|uniref:autotransporter outer membrane beta-barrel domain-containing protein n=1 Tax=Chromobacterium violaceum TaxID=536 RepID=UPI0009DAA5FC|nr:autotransporter outer membrane beta-barrel domain-containing protein [Chromobacterium violaceum]
MKTYQQKQAPVKGQIAPPPLFKITSLAVAAAFCVPQQAHAACSGSSTVSCTGSLSGSLSYGSGTSEIDLVNANLSGTVTWNNPTGPSVITISGSTLSTNTGQAFSVNNANGALSMSLDAASQITSPNSGSGAVSLTTSTSNTGDILLNSAASVSGKGGLLTWNNGSGSITISNSGSVVSNNQSGLGATTAAGGSISITNASGGQTQASNGNAIDTHSNGASGDTVIVNNGSAISTGNASGINSTSNGGNIAIQNNGQVVAGGTAITATNTGAGNITINSSGTINQAGTAAAAIGVNSNGGQVGIDTRAGSVNGSIFVTANNGGVQATVGNIASNSNAVVVTYTGSNANAGGVSLNTAAGTDISTSFAGIAVTSQGNNGGISVTTNGTIGGAQAVRNGVIGSITASGNNANVQMQLNNTVNAVRTAIAGSTAGNGNVSIVSQAALSSQQGHGISASSAGGNVSVTANGAVTGVTAIRGSSTSGNVALTANANTTGTGAVALSGNQLSGAALQVANAVQATVDNYANATTQSVSVAAVDVNAGSAVVNNHAGALLAGAGDFAINGRNGNVTVNNDGTITGYVTLQGSGNTFNNNSSHSLDLRNYVAGVQNVAVAQINGVFNNNADGVLRVLAVNAPQSVNNAGAWQTGGSQLPGNGVVQGQLTGVSNFNNSGTITLQSADIGATQAVAGKLLVITGGQTAGASGGGTYTSNGGQLRLDAVLNQGGAASLNDMLVVDRTAVGSGGATRVSVNNVGGLGGYTGNGPSDGIELIKVLDAGYSAANAFSLAVPLGAGAFQYSLRQADGQNWYLQTTDLVPLAKIQAMLPVALSQYGLDTLGTLWQRVGSRRYQPQQQDEAGRPAAWVRAGGHRGYTEGSIAGNGFSYASSYQLNDDFIEIGADHRLWQSGKGSWIGSLFGSHGNGSMKLQNGADGRADLSSNSLGLAATWYGNNGYYLDMLGKWSRIGTRLAATGVNGSPDGHSALFSLETGYQRAISRDWSVVPQLQLVWQDNRLDGYTDSNGVKQQADNDRNLMGRLGVAMRYAKPEAEGRGFNGYIKADLLHSFQNSGLVTFSGTPLAFQSSRNSMELGVGGNWSNAKRTVDTYVELNYRHALGGNAGYTAGGMLGARYHW